MASVIILVALTVGTLTALVQTSALSASHHASITMERPS